MIALMALGAGACGGSSSKPTAGSQPTAARSGSRSPTTLAGFAGAPTTAAIVATTGHLGDTLSRPDQYLKSDVETVTLVKVIDPVTPNVASNVADPGTRWVGLDMTFVDNGANSADAQDQALVTGSDGKQYLINADIEGEFEECTSTMHDLRPNQKATFCPGFLLPTGVTITKVGYSLHGSDLGVASELTWTVP